MGGILNQSLGQRSPQEMNYLANTNKIEYNHHDHYDRIKFVETLDTRKKNIPSEGIFEILYHTAYQDVFFWLK